MKFARALLIATGLAVAIVVACYLAGGLYFVLCKVIPSHIALDTWLRYWDAYGDDPIQRKRLLTSAALAVTVVAGAPLLAIAKLTNLPRSLHGDARWATRSEIRKAGLL